MRIYERNADGRWVWAEHVCEHDEDDFDPDTGFERVVQWASWAIKALLAWTGLCTWVSKFVNITSSAIADTILLLLPIALLMMVVAAINQPGVDVSEGKAARLARSSFAVVLDNMGWFYQIVAEAWKRPVPLPESPLSPKTARRIARRQRRSEELFSRALEREGRRAHEEDASPVPALQRAKQHEGCTRLRGFSTRS